MITLRPSQKLIIHEELTRNNLLVVSPMGSGKTLATLTALLALCNKNPGLNVVIVAPKRVARNVWVQEAKERGIPLNIRFCDTLLDIKLFLSEPSAHHVAVCSVTKIDQIPHGCWDMGVVDESTLFGNKTSLRSGHIRRIFAPVVTPRMKREFTYFPLEGKKIRKRIILSGTPVHGGYEKLFHQMFLLDGGKALGTSLESFRWKYMKVKQKASGAYVSYEIRNEMIPAIHERIKHLTLVVKDKMPLPDILYKTIKVSLPYKRMVEYEKFEQTSVVAFKAETGDDPFETDNKLVTFAKSAHGSKLRQLASGCVYLDEDRKSYAVTHTEKFEALDELIYQTDRGVIVTYQFLSEHKEIVKRYPYARQIKTTKDVEDWNAGRIKMIVTHAASIGHGLNLQFGGCTVVWFSQTYDAEMFAQLNERVHRPGQLDPVVVAMIVADNTIEIRVQKTVLKKIQITEAFITNS